MFKTSDLNYDYPAELVATEPQPELRAMVRLTSDELSPTSTPESCSKPELFKKFQAGDTLVINDTKVVRRRVFTESGLEILFLKDLGENTWEVLFPASKIKNSEAVMLPQKIEMKLLERGLPQKVQVSSEITEEYFAKSAELALPPYIQAAREERHMRPEDVNWYQTQWASSAGSSAAPTASLHFTNKDLEKLAGQGVNIVRLTLHVGMGTFLPIKTAKLEDHKMHGELVQIPQSTLQQIEKTKSEGHRVWALGTTVTRSLESWAHHKLQSNNDGSVSGTTDLFIRPGFEFKVVDALLTNFHQPESTLLSLVMAFAGVEEVRQAYKWAIENEFKLFSYGDLSVWLKK